MKSILFSFLFLFSATMTTPDELTLTNHGENLTTVTRDQYVFPFQNSLFIEQDKFDLLFERIEKKVYQDPVDAKLDDQGEIIKEKNGATLDRQAFAKQFSSFFYSGNPTKLEIPKKPVYPKVDSELLANIHDEKIGSYVTQFKSGNKERTNNIELATKAINNHVLFPGETFSFNKVVGKRTKAKGYKQAPVIVKGELAEDIGGGICQVSSTLYNAVDLRGIEMVERYSHSKSVPYVPSGRDATVSWYGPDFAFKNHFHRPILIRANAKNGNMNIHIYSSSTPKSKND